MNQNRIDRPASPPNPESKGSSFAESALLDRMYRTALLLTDTEEQAEAMVLKALHESVDNPDAAANSEIEHIRNVVDLSTTFDSHPDFRSHIRSSIVRRLLTNNFPIAFVALDRDEQLALYLHFYEKLSFPEAEKVLTIERGSFAAFLDAATSRVVELFLESLPTTERGLVLDEDDDEWIGKAICDAIDSLLPAAPDSLRSKSEQVADEASIGKKHVSASSGGSDISKMIGAGVILAAVLFASLWWLTADEAPPPRPIDLLALTLNAAGETVPDLSTSSEMALEEYVQQQTGRQIVVPRFRDSELTGASIASIDRDLDVPAISYRDNSEWGPTPFTVFVYSYKMLGERERGPRLASAVLRSLDSEISFTHAPSGTDTLLVWRHRTNIYVAVGVPQTIKSLEARTELQLPLGSR